MECHSGFGRCSHVLRWHFRHSLEVQKTKRHIMSVTSMDIPLPRPCITVKEQWRNNLCWITGLRFHVLHLIQRNCLVPSDFHRQATLNHDHWTMQVSLNKSRPFRSFVQFLLGTCVYMSGRFLPGIPKFDHFWHTWIREAEDGLWLREIGEFRVRDAVFRRVGKQSAELHTEICSNQHLDCFLFFDLYIRIVKDLMCCSQFLVFNFPFCWFPKNKTHIL